ncbi:F-box domain containing protein [Pandoravirus salinus]|uniref:F-box domain containing protein n=1 Tax=Pandoravirus salinus TaxID=1349410 RepID=S4W5N6_9VIRU|nr:F-box domain [Pandoravirus salinus]AGO85685.1 F-box domain containing protein [Pandoravirus salinus]
MEARDIDAKENIAGAHMHRRGAAGIDELPDEILMHIFSFLLCLEKRATTSAVSWRWRAVVGDARQSAPGCADSVLSLTPRACLKKAIEFDHAVCMRAALRVCDGPTSRTAPKWAARHGAMRCLGWLRAVGYSLRFGAFDEAAAGGHVKVLDYLKTAGVTRGIAAWRLAAGRGHVNVMDWLRSNRCPYDGRACEDAASNGQLGALAWLHQNGYPWRADACVEAARAGQMSALAWLHENGCPWDDRVVRVAIQGGHLHCLCYAHENQCPMPRTWRWMRRRRHPHVLDYVTEHDLFRGRRNSLQQNKKKDT